MNYNKNMKLELFKVEDDSAAPELLDTFLLEGIQTSYDYELDQQTKEHEKAKKKAEKKKANATDDEKEEKPEKEETEELKIVNPKVKLSIELTRSGYILVPKATVGISDSRRSFLDVKQVRKDTQISEDGLKQAKNRLKWYQKRDEDKIKTDMAMNDFESMIYSMREWLREDDNAPFVEETEREAQIA